MQQEPLSILLADDHEIVCLGLRMLLDAEGAFKICGQTDTAGKAVDLATKLQPDLIVVDLMMGGRDGIELIRELRQVAPSARIIVYSALSEIRYARRALRVGAIGYVMKSAGLLKLQEALALAAIGQPYASEAVHKILLDDCVGRKPDGSDARLNQLSNKELHVFQLLGSGLKTVEIAVRMGVSIKTVSTYRERIKNKMNLHNARELERSAEEHFQTISAN